VEYLGLWDPLADRELNPDLEDSHIWKFSSSGKYSAKSAYEAMFVGAICFQPWGRIWKSWAPGQCKFFMWLVSHNKCWTTDRLAKRGRPHPEKCPLCDQEEETINHLIFSCVFALQAWFEVLQVLGLRALVPEMADSSFEEWWHGVNNKVNGQSQKGLNSIIILVAWSIWNHRNRCVLEVSSPI
jgi:hypothetical protein